MVVILFVESPCAFRQRRIVYKVLPRTQMLVKLKAKLLYHKLNKNQAPYPQIINITSIR